MLIALSLASFSDCPPVAYIVLTFELARTKSTAESLKVNTIYATRDRARARARARGESGNEAGSGKTRNEEIGNEEMRNEKLGTHEVLKQQKNSSAVVWKYVECSL